MYVDRKNYTLQPFKYYIFLYVQDYCLINIIIWSKELYFIAFYAASKLSLINQCLSGNARDVIDV